MRSLMLTLGFLSLLAPAGRVEANHRQTARFSFRGGHPCAAVVPATTAFSYRRSVAFVPRTTAALTLVQPFQVTQRYNVVAPAAVSFRPRVAYTPVPTATYAPPLTYAAPAPCACEQPAPAPVPVPTPTPFTGGGCYGSGCYGGGCSGLSVQGMSYPETYSDVAATDYDTASLAGATASYGSAGVGAVDVDVASPYAALLAVQERQRRGLLSRLFHRRHQATPATGFTIREGRRGFTFRGGY
jgi:hypothetical protein